MDNNFCPCTGVELGKQIPAFFNAGIRLPQVYGINSAFNQTPYQVPVFIRNLWGCYCNDLHFFRASIIRSATFFPDNSIPPKIGPILGVPLTADAAIPHT